MKIIVECGGRYKNDEKAENILNHHVGYIDSLMSALKKKFKFRLPAELVLRPLYYRGIAMMAGRFNYNSESGYSIALNIEACRQRKNKGEVIVKHECAHFANMMLHKDWGHGEKFRKMKSVCCKLMRKANGRNRRNSKNLSSS